MLCKLIFINPATSAVSDRFFSTSRRLKLWLRSRMNQERFSNLIVLNIQKEHLTGLSTNATQIESVILSLFNYMMYSNFNFIFFTILDLHNSSYHTQPHPIIANYAALIQGSSGKIVGFLAYL